MSSVEHSGAPLHYQDEPRRLPWAQRGEPVLLHHGVGACAAVWAGWEPALAGRHRLVRPDMRGHGASTVPAGYSWALDALVGDLAAVAGHAGLDRFHLVGESIGATIALAFAARHPERVHSLTLSNGAHRGAPIRNLAPWPAILQKGGTTAWSTYMMGMRFVEGALDEEQRNWFEQQQATADATAVLALAATLAATDLGPELGAVTMPVLLLHPDSSPFIPVSLMAELHEALPDSRLEVVPGARHGLPFSHAAHCSTAVAAFLDGVEARHA